MQFWSSRVRPELDLSTNKVQKRKRYEIVWSYKVQFWSSGVRPELDLSTNITHMYNPLYYSRSF